MDGDFTYATADIQKFLDHARGYDQIVGARSWENVSRVHRFGNRIISAIFNLFFGTSISDVCSGMYLLNTSSAQRLFFRTKGFSVEVEILAQLAQHGRITEVPIDYRERIGESKLSTVTGGVDIVKSIFGLARIYNPIFVFSLAAASAAIPGVAILSWVLWGWFSSGYAAFHSGWALAGGMLLLLASQAFAIGTVSLIMKRSEMRIERLMRSSQRDQASFTKPQVLERPEQLNEDYATG